MQKCRVPCGHIKGIDSSAIWEQLKRRGMEQVNKLQVLQGMAFAFAMYLSGGVGQQEVEVCRTATASPAPLTRHVHVPWDRYYGKGIAHL